LAIAPAAATELPQGLVLHLSFDEWKSDSVPDQSGRGNNGRGTAVKWVPSAKQGGGCEFGATGSAIRVAVSPSMKSRQGAIALWFKAGARSRDRRIMEKNGVDGFSLDLGEQGTLRFSARGHVCTGDSMVADDVWHHVAATFDEDAVKLYADGVLQKQTAASAGAVATNGSEVVVGMKDCDCKAHENAPSLEGLMDEVMMYDHALTPAEVRTVMAYIKPKFTKAQVAQRLADLKDLLDRGLVLQDFYDRKVKECESGQ
jgi:hypothetical protein